MAAAGIRFRCIHMAKPALRHILQCLMCDRKSFPSLQVGVEWKKPTLRCPEQRVDLREESVLGVGKGPTNRVSIINGPMTGLPAVTEDGGEGARFACHVLSVILPLLFAPLLSGRKPTCFCS